jgi:flagellar hook-associated protein 1 FlgK
MRSTFYGLEIVRKGLFASQKGPGCNGPQYSQCQYPGLYPAAAGYVLCRAGGIRATGQFTYTSKGQVGNGVTIQELSQIRDKFIDLQYRKENTSLGEWMTKTDAFNT